MKNPKLSTTLSEELKKDSTKDRKRRVIANISLIAVVLVFAVLAKLYIFRGDIKINDEKTKTPSEKIESQPSENDSKAATEKKPENPAPVTPAPQTTPAPAEDAYTAYVIKEGDTLGGIANENGMTSKQLMDYNGIVDPASIMPGQTIKIPKS